MTLIDSSSRYRFSTIHTDGLGRSFLGARPRFGYRDLPDNRAHTVREGDTLHRLAWRYFRPLRRAELLWWIVADFQPEPIHDPTQPLEPGRVLLVPSIRTVQELILTEARRREPA